MDNEGEEKKADATEKEAQNVSESAVATATLGSISKKEKIIYAAIGVIILAAIIVLSVRITTYYVELNRSRRIAELSRQLAASAARQTPAPRSTPSAPTPAPALATATAPAATPEPEAPREPVMHELILNLREAFDNDDIIAYVRIEGTNIDYAVVQGPDNDFYLARDLNKKKNTAGSVYLDYENHPYILDRNNILYGHNMRNGSMFHNLRYYTGREFYENHRYITYTTLYEQTRWEIFAVYNAFITFNYIQVNFNSDDEFMELVNGIKSRSVINTGITLNPEDTILTLSTCTNVNVVERFVISARLIEAIPHQTPDAN